MLHRAKILGIFVGYFLWGIPGALAGLLVGYAIDKQLLALKKPHYAKATTHELSGLQAEYLAAIFKVMGYIAVSGGRGADDDTIAVNLAFDRLQLPKIDRPQALRYFQEGKRPGFDLNDVLFTFCGFYRDRPELIEMFIELQIYAINNDGKLSSPEQEVLFKIGHLLELTKADVERIYNTIQNDQQVKRSKKRHTNGVKPKAKLADAYAVLNTSPNASDDEIKTAYRRLRSVHHPDKLVAQGLPDEMLKTAEDKTREIRAAYEAIKSVRNL